jgi:hypothetical protein
LHRVSNETGRPPALQLLWIVRHVGSGVPDVVTLGTEIAPWVLEREDGPRRMTLGAFDVEFRTPVRVRHSNGSLLNDVRACCSELNNRSHRDLVCGDPLPRSRPVDIPQHHRYFQSGLD